MSSQLRGRVLIVDDEISNLKALKKILNVEAFETIESIDGTSALQKFRDLSPDMIITDYRMPEMNGMELLKAVRQFDQNVPVVMVTAFGTVDDAVEAMKLGAIDFISKPISRKALLKVVQDVFSRIRPKPNTEQSEDLIGNCSQITQLRRTIHMVAPTKASVFIEGESGTGKEVVAKAIHRASDVSGELVSINCAAIPENLLESELFGYERGAFTGANGTKRGLLELANKGTIFLDEIADMPTSLQTKLLRVIENGKFYRVGGTKPTQVELRIISATNSDVQQLVEEGKFREDLWFRLNVLHFQLPPLRERGADIEYLADIFLQNAAVQYNKNGLQFSKESIMLMNNYSWPGNIRELLNIVERAVVLVDGFEIRPRDLRIRYQELKAKSVGGATETVLSELSGDDLRFPMGTSLREMEETVIKKTLDALNGDKALAAKILGINVRTIYRKLQGELKKL